MKLITAFLATLSVLAAIDDQNLISAATINGITADGQFLYVDNISINDVGVSTAGGGLEFKFGAQILGGSLGYSIGGIFTPTGATTPTFAQSLSPCGPITTAPNFCSRSAAVSNPN